MADFAVDSAKRHLVSSKLLTASGDIRDLTTSIYEGIKGLEGDDSWKGASYTHFAEMCEGYHEALDGLADMLEAFSKIIGEQIDEPEETLETALKETLS